ncbi:MAG: GNAT family N-acetyltransferase [Candidatus Hermodarchaeota archaeon]
MKLDLYVEGDVEIRKAHHNEIREIYAILSKSFEPYNQYYTEKAYEATVISPREIEKRINDEQTEVLVVIHKDKVVGTVSIIIQERKKMHLRSMAVKPSYQRKGIGSYIIEEINKLAREKQVKIISLECFEPLIQAINLYEKFGFRKTGRKRDYHGIRIFEMIKEAN